MKRVLHIINTGGPGGAETVFLDLVTRLNGPTWESHAVIPDDGWLDTELRRRGHEPIILPTGGSFDIRYLRELRRIIRRTNIDLIQAHLFGPSIYGSVAGAMNGVPVISTFHGDVDIAADEPYAWLKFRFINHGSRRIVFVSDRLSASMLAKHPLRAERAVVVENGIDLREFARRDDATLRAELGVPAHAFLVGAVGNIRPAKRYDVFLRAAAELLRRGPDYYFVVLGHWHGDLDPDLVSLHRELGLGQRVKFAGFRTDIARMFNNLDAYLLTSDSEGFSLSTIQALASEVPVVTTRCGGPEAILIDQETGLLVNRADERAIADAIERLRLEPFTRRRLQRAGRELVVRHFDVERQVQRYADLYQQVLAAQPVAAL